MSWRLAWRQCLRQFRAGFVLGGRWQLGEQGVWVLALTVAVLTLTAVTLFTSRMERAMALRANEVLAADLRINSNRRPVTPAYLQAAQQQGLNTAEVQSFPSVVIRDELSSLASIQAVSTGYPLRGALKVSDGDAAVAYLTNSLPAADEVWVEPRLLARLNMQVGDVLQVGEATLRVGKLLLARPDQGSQFASLAPSVLLRLETLPTTKLVGPGSRVQYAQLFAGERSRVAQFAESLTPRLQPWEKRQQTRDASEQTADSLERANRFLRLTSLISVLLAAVAVAMASRRHAARQLDTAALMKALGASQRMVLMQNLWQLLWLSLLAGVLGTALGLLAQQGLSMLARNLLQSALPLPDFSAVWLGLLTPLIISLGVALPPLLQLQRVPPVRVLRHQETAPPLHYAWVYLLAVAALLVLLWALLRDLQLMLIVGGGTIAVLLLLAAAGALLVRSLRGVRTQVGVSWRYGIANVVRRGRSSIVQVVAFGLGLMVLLVLMLVRNDLLKDWRASLPGNAPNQFLVNIAPEQRAEVQSFFASHNVKVPELSPMLRARLSHINNTVMSAWQAPTDRGRGFADREANLSWAQELPAGNTLVAGQWWSNAQGSNAQGPQVSVEQEFAKDLGVKLGDKLTYDVSGTPVTATVTSLRAVRWDTFTPNFFVLFAPGVLDEAVGTYVASVHVPTTQRGTMAAFYRQFPEVTAIDVAAVLAQVRAVLDDASRAVQYVFMFALLSGITVLLAAVQASYDERRQESALLRALGASRRVVQQGVAAEFLVLGTLSGLLAALGATLIGYLLATRVFHFEYQADWLVWWVGLASGALLVGGAGVLATRRIVNASPMLTLRQQ